MRTVQYLIFFSIALTILGLVNYYIGIRGWQAIPEGTVSRGVYSAVIVFLAISYIAARLLERAWQSPVTSTLTWIGSLWMGAMIYFLMIVFLLDLARFSNHFLHFYPAFITANYTKAKFTTFLISCGIVFLIVLVGFINTRIPKVTTLDLRIHKKVDGFKTLNIAAASDLHLGKLVGAGRVRAMTDIMRRLNPDIVLFSGDILDEDIASAVCKNICVGLENVHPRFGFFTVPGNHEHYGGITRALSYLTEQHITVLQDKTVKIGDSFYIVGREDPGHGGNPENRRKPLKELLTGIDLTKPIILLDHQPLHLEEAAENGVDLQISGHTHHGQLWPFNYITSMTYEISRGYKLIEKTHFYVSSGFGTWGPPIRTNSRPEIVNIRLTFD
ncbi:MAG: metallophosphoesterase [Candidatus Marinimicrobia bacterium CG08_land_8_20_14_0_20_45_22]|nr:MAG: metallophosphoesterase [Candidatus Marinimicrobia bacterium CG08_land_8_20_14_0_20_45_22]